MEKATRPGTASEVLISSSEIAKRVSELATEISEEYARSDLLALVILRGGFVFASDLLRRLDPAINVAIDFMTVTSYGDRTTSSGEIQIAKEPDLPVEGKDVLIIEDILETGITLEFVRDRIVARGARSVRFATLLEKAGKRQRDVASDYVGFQIPDVFVVGYGLDHAQKYRNLPEIRVFAPDITAPTEFNAER